MLLLFLLGISTLVSGKAQDHEIVYPRMIVSRSGEKRVMFSAFSQDFHLKLEPTNVLSDDFVLITRADDELAYVKPDVEHLRKSILQDPASRATIAVDESGPLQIKGIINEELRIEPDPTFHSSQFKKSGGKKGRGHGGHGGHGGNRHGYKKGRMYGDFSQNADQVESRADIPHRVTKVTPRVDGGFFDEVIPPGVKEDNSNLSSTDARQSKKITVEVAAVLDRVHSSRFRNDADALQYTIVLFNSARMRFSTMKNSDLDIKLSKLKRNMVAADEPYVTKNMYYGHALSGPLLYDFANYVATNPDLSSADMAKLITATPMGDKEDTPQKVNPGVIGIAFVGGVCDKNYKAGVSEDNGRDFDGSCTVAHEMAHLLGCPHDGDEPVSYLPNSPGAKDCSWDLGYIMSYVRQDEKQFAFSSCSEKCFLHLASLRSASCMFRQDVREDINMQDSRLPGQYLAQTSGLTDMESIYNSRCSSKRSDLFVYKLPKDGCHYSCRSPSQKNGSFYYWNMQALDGDPCSPNKVCLNGICSALKK